jgi:sterol desaturase/sphingolipid hydroxylase (fatty acid hydroxylase superfamily)
MMWNLIGRTKRSWLHFTRSKPGDRFQVRYYRRKQSGPGQLSRIINVVVGSILVIFSAFFGWAPGPGTLTFVIGLAMIGGEFLTIARFLDWSEVWLRKLAHLVGVVWRSSTIGKALIVLVALALVIAFGYVIYSVFFAG